LTGDTRPLTGSPSTVPHERGPLAGAARHAVTSSISLRRGVRPRPPRTRTN